MSGPAGLAPFPRIALPDRIDAVAVRACDASLPVVTLGGETMGTAWRIHAVPPPGVAPEGIGQVAQKRLDALVAQMSHWEADSELSRFNREQSGGGMTLSPDFAFVMQAALDVAQASGGAFNPAMGHLVDMWGFGPPGPVASEPEPFRIAQALPCSDWRLLAFEPQTRRLRQPGGLALDLSGIAKGYAVDAVMSDLMAMGVIHVLVEVGGELSGRGLRPGGQPWWVDLEHPPAARMPGLRVALHGLSVATSGNYVRGPHNLDPRTGAPAAHHVAACSVLHASAMIADAWASALSVSGVEAGLLLATRNSLAVRWVVQEGNRWSERLSPALCAMLEG